MRRIISILVLVATPAVAADLPINPITATLSAGDWVYNKFKDTKPPPVLTKEKITKFEKMSKEDWVKDDPHADMWDRNWVSAVQPIEYAEVKPVVINKPPVLIKKKIRHRVKIKK